MTTVEGDTILLELDKLFPEPLRDTTDGGGTGKELGC
jgi:hypothetical protein